MSESSFPPADVDGSPPAARRRWGWLIHVLVLAAYPLAIGLMGHLSRSESSAPVLPASTSALIVMAGVELLVFVLVFGAAWFASGATCAALYLPWRGGWWPLVRGPVYSVLLRILIAVLVIVVVLAGLPSGRPK